MQLVTAPVLTNIARCGGFAKIGDDAASKVDRLLLHATKHVMDPLLLVARTCDTKTLSRKHLDLLFKLAPWLSSSSAPSSSSLRKRAVRGGGDYFQAAEYYGKDSGRYFDAGQVAQLQHSSVGSATATRQALAASSPPFDNNMVGGCGCSAAAAAPDALSFGMRGGGDYFQAAEYYGKDSGRYFDAGQVAQLQHSSVGSATATRQALAASSPPFDNNMVGGAGARPTTFMTEEVVAKVLREFRQRRTDDVRVADDAKKPIKALIELTLIAALLAAKRKLKSKVLTARVLDTACGMLPSPYAVAAATR